MGRLASPWHSTTSGQLLWQSQCQMIFRPFKKLLSPTRPTSLEVIKIAHFLMSQVALTFFPRASRKLILWKEYWWMIQPSGVGSAISFLKYFNQTSHLSLAKWKIERMESLSILTGSISQEPRHCTG